jgi:glycine oxidase
METTTDVVIVGGGVIGCAIAYYLRKSHVSVTVVERGEIGGQASGAAAGLLAPLGPLSGPGPLADFLLAGCALFPSLVQTLEAETSLQLGYRQTGALRTVRNPKRIAHLKKRYTSWLPLGLEMHWLSGDEARQLEPQLSPDVCATVYAPAEGQIRAPQLVLAFAQAARQQGAIIHPHTEIVGVETTGTSVTGVRTAQGDVLRCHTLIVATGSWAALCAQWFHVSLPIRPLHGQLISLQQPSPPLQHIIFGEAAYLVPGADTLIVGATREETDFQLAVTEEGISWLQDTARRLVPTLASSERTAAWAGLRPKTPDHQPLLGPLPGWQNVLLAAGHNSIGIMTGALTGQSIATLLTTGQMPQIIRPFSVERVLPSERLFTK